MSDGSQRLQALQDAGFSDAEVSAWQADRTKALLDGGFSQADVAKYWGQKNFDSAPLKQYFEKNLAIVRDKPNLSFGDYLDAGWQMSVTGLIKRQKMPDTLLPQDAPMWGRIAYNVSQMVGDLPAGIAGAFAGSQGGSAVGTPVGAAIGSTIPGAGTMFGGTIGGSAGALLGGGYGSNALPAYIRRVLVDAYTKGSIKDFNDFWSRSAAAFVDAHHAGEVGALTAGVSRLVGTAAAPVMSPLAARSTQMASEITTMVVAGKAVQGQVPTAQDFADAAVLVGGMHLAMLGAGTIKTQTSRIAQKLGNNYAATGIRPEEVVADAANDPVVRQDIASDNIDVPGKYAGQIDPDGVMTPPREPVRVPEVLREQATAIEGSSPSDIAIPITQVEISSRQRGAIEALPQGIRERFLNHYQSAANAKPIFDDAVREIASDVDAKAILTDLKEVPRAVEKVSVDYNGDVSQLKDVVRGTLMVQNLNSANQALAEIEHRFSRPVSIRNALDPDSSPVSNDGYRDIKLNVRVRGHIAELQINLPEMIAAKNRAHSLYEQARKLESVWGAEARDPTPSEYAQYEGLREQQRAIYAAAWDAFLTRSRNSASETKVPLVSNEEMGNRRPPETSQARQTPSGVSEQGTPSTSANLVPLGNETGNISTSKSILSDQRASEILGKNQSLAEKLTSQRGGPKITSADILDEQPTPQDEVLARISMTETSRKPPTLAKLYTALVDDLHPLKQLTRMLAGDEPLNVKDDPYQLARLTRGATGKADHFLEFSPVKFETLENVGKPLSKILEPVKDDLDGLRAYAVSKRALELNERGIETGVPLEAAQKTVADGAEAFEPAFRELQQYQKYTLQYLRDSGILSAEAFDKISEANKDYVPFYRLMEEGEGISGPGTTGKGLSVRSPVKGIKGSERMIVDPLESIIKNTYLYVQLAERNRALSALADLAESAGEHGAELMERVPTPMRPITVSGPEIARFMEENGISADTTPDEMTIFRPRSAPLAPDEIAVYADGKKQVYRVSPEVATAVRALDRESTGLALRMAAFPARALRAGTTLSPEFVARNFIRDQMTAFNLGEKGFIPVFDTLRGLGSLFTKDEDYQNFLKSGGANAAMVALDRDYIEQNIFKMENDTGLLSKTWNVLKSPLEILRATSEIVENSTRLGEYKRLTKGETDIQTIMEGGMGAREVTLDFQRVGAQTRALNMIVAFWNAHVQGLDKTARAFIDRPLETAVKLGVSVTLPSVLLWFANKDDPRWKEIPQWQKDLFWIVMTKDHIYRIPKPMELGIIFGSIPERALDAYHTDNPRAFKNLSESLIQAFTPSYIPTFAVPVVEQFANRSTFTGNPIIPQGMEGILPEYQYTEYTTEAGKILGKFAAAVPGMKDSSFSSPMVLENYIRAWSGQLGMYALKVADEVLIDSGAVPDPVKPASSLADIPIIKAFVVRYPAASAQSIQDFYDNYDQVNRRVTTIKYLAKQGDFAAAMELLKSQQDEQGMILLTGIKDALATQTKFIHLVAKNPAIEPPEKRQIIDGVYYRMIETARRGNEMIDQLNKKAAPIVMPRSEPRSPPTSQERARVPSGDFATFMRKRQSFGSGPTIQ